MAKVKNKLLVSADTFEQILDGIRDFYCGSEKVLIPVSANEWMIANPPGDKPPVPLSRCRVILQRGRFRFEMLT